MSTDTDIVSTLRDMRTPLAVQAADLITKLRAERDAAARDMRERALARIEQLRVSAASNFKDANCQGQRGQDRTDALYDAYQAVRSIGATAIIATDQTGGAT